jgi:hypothetical protein
MGVRPDAPAIETIVLVTFYEIIILSAPMIANFPEIFFILLLQGKQRYG